MLLQGLISLFLMKIAMVDTLTSLQSSDEESNPVSEVSYLPNTIHDILDKAVSNWGVNSVFILFSLSF